MLRPAFVLARVAPEVRDSAVAAGPVRPQAVQPQVSTLLVRPLLFAVGRRGPAALEELFRTTGLTAETCADADARIDADLLRAAWCA